MKLLKSYSAYNLALLLAATAAFAGCSKDDLPGTEPAGGDVAATTFAVSVSDSGYASSDADPHTRAAENDYQTVFTEGDQIGVFAVKNNAIMDDVKNLCLTAASDGKGGLVWTDATGKAPLNLPDITYYAYYPYRSGLTGSLVPNATTAEGFFANVISSWTPATDQSTYAKYTAQDLMVAEGMLTGRNLSFSMKHQMSLVVIDLPTEAKYSLSGDNTYQWTADVPGTQFTDFSPFRMIDKTYRYLVKPNSASSKLSGTSSDGNTTKKWEFSYFVEAGKFKVYRVDGGSKTQLNITYTLRVGDFYMNDGSLISSKANLTDAQKQACIGVVFWVGDVTAKDKILKADHPGCTHGLVVALRDAQTQWQSSAALVQQWLDRKQWGIFLPVQGGTDVGHPINNIQGYNNTKALEAFNAVNGGNVVQAVQRVADYRTTVPAPANSSNWYLPSAKELSLVCGNDITETIYNANVGGNTREAINEIFKKIGGKAMEITVSNYWSSTENDIYGAIIIYFAGGYVYTGAKDNSGNKMRCILAF